MRRQIPSSRPGNTVALMAEARDPAGVPVVRDRTGQPLVTGIRVGAFRSVRSVEVSPRGMCALVGEAAAGKSNLLAALRAVLDPSVELLATDVPFGAGGAVEVRATLGTGSTFELRGAPHDVKRSGDAGQPPVVFLPARARAEEVVAPMRTSTPAAKHAVAAFVEALDPGSRAASDGVPALSLLDAVHTCCESGVEGVVLLIEEPELYLGPQAQRYLYRLLRGFAAAGNQVIYSTHSPAFLNVAHLDELVFVERRAGGSTRALQPETVSPDDDFRVLSEFDAERAELFLARAAVLVEGQTEKLAFPFVFDALGHDVDQAGIAIVECGGKSNIPLFARICRAAGIPFLAVHDRDARPGRQPSSGNLSIAAAIRALAGPEHTVELAPDFEAVAGIRGGGHGKPERAWRRFATLTREQLPDPLVRAAELALDLARTGTDGR